MMTSRSIEPTAAAPTPERIARHIAEGRRLRAEAANGAVLAVVHALTRGVGRAAAATTAAVPAGRKAAAA